MGAVRDSLICRQTYIWDCWASSGCYFTAIWVCNLRFTPRDASRFYFVWNRKNDNATLKHEGQRREVTQTCHEPPTMHGKIKKALLHTAEMLHPHTPEFSRSCSIAAFIKWLLHTHIYVVIKWIWIELVGPSESLPVLLTLPEICNNLYFSGLSAPGPLTVPSGCLVCQKINGHKMKSKYPQINGPQNGAKETNYKASDALVNGCFKSDPQISPTRQDEDHLKSNKNIFAGQQESLESVNYCFQQLLDTLLSLLYLSWLLARCLEFCQLACFSDLLVLWKTVGLLSAHRVILLPQDLTAGEKK